MIKTIIIDDDLLHLKSLETILDEHFKHIDIVATCSNVPDAVKKIDELKPQLVFLDIEMSPYSGFDLLEMITERDFEVIFTTCYQKYAVQAIKASALDYIEKPTNRENVAEALQRFKLKTGNTRITNLLSNFRLDHEDQRIALSDKNELNFYATNKIVRCETDNSYTNFFILDENKKNGETIKVVVSKGLAYLEDFLVDKGFFYRVHNKHLINIYHIKKISKTQGGYLVMHGKPDVTIPIARSRKDDFLNFLKFKGIVT
jgi:two-component system LytT family response regulator